MKVRSENAVTN